MLNINIMSDLTNSDLPQILDSLNIEDVWISNIILLINEIRLKYALDDRNIKN